MYNKIRLECFRPVFDKVEEIIEKNRPCIIAIDGMCGSGKTYLANLLAEKYEVNVFHMDDFYLPPEMRTKERLEQPGGNVYYERFKKEVLMPLLEQNTVYYRPYLCGVWKYDEVKKIEYKKINIVEGSYSMHPYLREAYDLTVFLEVNSEIQKERILEREGEIKLQQFVSKWIPLENKYFNELKIKESSDISVDTTSNKLSNLS